jgi:isoamyl acetate esterase
MSGKRPSDTWQGVSGLNPESGTLHDQIHRVLGSADFRHLENVAVAARTRQEGSSAGTEFSCTIDSSVFTWGQNNVVFEVAFYDNVQWIAKVEHVPADPPDLEMSNRYMKSEVATLKKVREQTTVPVPRVFAHSSSRSGGFGFPYMLMEFLPGRVLDGRLAQKVPLRTYPKWPSRWRISCGSSRT